MTRILFFIAVAGSAMPVYAMDCENPCTLEMRASVTVYPILSEEICIQNPDATGCEDVTYLPEQKHPCEDRPELEGCRFFKTNEENLNVVHR